MVRRTLIRMMMGGATAASKKKQKKIPLCWLDLRGSGLSVLERLCLEECILHHDDRHWVMAGTHEPVRHKYLILPRSSNNVVDPAMKRRRTKSKNTLRTTTKESSSSFSSSWNVDSTSRNESAAIVMGIGGKPDLLLNVKAVRDDGVLTLKRFSGGGTVVLDYDSIWTTIIGRRQELVAEHFPRPIMEWSAQAIFGPMFERLSQQQQQQQQRAQNNNNNNKTQTGRKTTMVLDSKSCGAENSGRMITIPSLSSSVSAANNSDLGDCNPSLSFRLHENDYVLGERKMGGNAQSINKAGWLHHTSFLWDYQTENMAYLTLPSKRPAYRGDRSHDDFLVKLGDEAYPDLSKNDFYAALSEACHDAFDLERMTLPDAMRIVNEHGGMKAWFQNKSRTKVVDL